MEELVKTIKAISDETRVRIVKLLIGNKSLCVCEIMDALDITQTRASKNLKILKDAGFVVDRREGAWVHYSIDENPSVYVEGVLRLLKEWLSDDQAIKGTQRRKKTYAAG